MIASQLSNVMRCLHEDVAEKTLFPARGDYL